MTEENQPVEEPLKEEVRLADEGQQKPLASKEENPAKQPQEKPLEKVKAEEAPKEEPTPEPEKNKPKSSGEGKANLVHCALFLHTAGKSVTEDSLKKMAKAADVSVDEAQVKALVSALKGVDIDDAIKQSVAVAAPSAPASGGTKQEESKEEEKVEEKKEEAVEGLSGLFG